MQRFILRRLVLLVPVLIGITILVFGMIYMIPGDPVVVILGSDYTPENAELLREELGLNRPVIAQYASWLGNVLHGDLGYSIFPFGGVKYSGQPVGKLILSRLPTTLSLTIGTMILAVLLAIPLGVLSATRRNSIVDNVLRIVSMLGISMPVFWFGLLLILVFAVKLGWLPSNGNFFNSGPKALILPIVALGIAQAGLITRMTRSTMLEVLGEDYIRTARAKGLRESVVYYRHALRNALIPVVTVIGLQVGALLGGAVLTETIFSMPGLGRLLVESVFRRDYPVIQGCVLVITLLFVFTNLVVDILYAILDPRVRLV
ncbi:MAG: ABC transporter permease [Ardenticatenaceae bacterium]|nr:ABC transporter permease [Ardenticatenaceae bacterium]HBY99284.1 peptide ABC transporter [Chloroflexota bacterium]